MIYKYQQDSYLQKFNTKLVEIVEDEFMVTVSPGTQKKVKSFGVILEDTILFAEGGGQPCDQGTVTILHEEIPVELNVFYVLKKENRVIHLIDEQKEHSLQDLPPGLTVLETLNWERRHRHMLHHSGQHLISACAKTFFKFDTLSWCLGQHYCYVELGVEAMSEEEYKSLEDGVNDKIQEALPVTVHVYQENCSELINAETRGLPEGHTGDVRVVEIGNLDRNMCCGTHVSNVKNLEVIKFLKTEKKVFKKNKTCLLYFVVGREEVFKMFNDMREREEQISAVLNKTPPELVVSITQKMESLRSALKTVKELHEEVVMGIIDAFKTKDPMPSLFSLHREEGDQDLLNFVVRQFKGMDNLMIFLTVGKKTGMMLLVGPSDRVQNLGPQVCSLLKGKGKATNSRFQAKVDFLGARPQAEDLLKQALSSVFC